MKIIKRKIVLGCSCSIILFCCIILTVEIFFYDTIADAISWDTVVKNCMDDPGFRKKIEELLALDFPASAEWGKSEYRVWQDAMFHCDLTLPKKDVDMMLPPNKVTWYENDHNMLPQWSKKWLKGKKLEHFKVIKYEPRRKLFVTVAVDNPPEISEDQRVWVSIDFLWL